MLCLPVLATSVDGTRTVFRVSSIRIVDARASGIDPMDGGRTGARLALVTCYPFDGVVRGKLRYVVIADREHVVAER
jgi:sortase A